MISTAPLEERDVPHEVCAVLGVLAHDRPLLGRQLALLPEDRVGYAVLANVVERGSEPDVVDLVGIGDAHGVCQARAVLAYAETVPAGPLLDFLDVVVLFLRSVLALEHLREADEHAFVGLVQLVLRRAKLALECALVALPEHPPLALPQRSLDRFLDHAKFEGLGEEVAGQPDGLHGYRGLVGQRRDDHAGRAGVDLGLDLPQEVDAVHPRHADVGDDQVVLGFGDLLDTLVAVGGLIAGVPHAFEDLAQQVPEDLLVIDDEDVGHGTPSAPPGTNLRTSSSFRLSAQ